MKILCDITPQILFIYVYVCVSVFVYNTCYIFFFLKYNFKVIDLYRYFIFLSSIKGSMLTDFLQLSFYYGCVQIIL